MSAVLAAVVATVLVLGFFLLLRPRGATGIGKAPGWVSFAAGALGIVAVASPMIGSALAPDGVDAVGKVFPNIFQVSLVLGVLGLAVGIFALVRRDRGWRVWVGLVTGGLVTAFWLVFLVGEIVSPH